MANYVDKMEFHNLLKDYKTFDNMLKDTELKLSDDEIIIVTKKKNKVYEKIGKCFLLIAENFTNRPRYINYSQEWKDDLISEAVFDMVKYIDNYDIDKMNSRYETYGTIPDPFSYFSQYARNGMMRYLKEKYSDASVLVRLPFIENMDKREFSYE